MTGAETKELLIQALRAKYWLLQRPEDVEQAFAEALAALYPCVVLSADEVAKVRTLAVAEIGWNPALAIEGYRKGELARYCLALLTPEKVEQP